MSHGHLYVFFEEVSIQVLCSLFFKDFIYLFLESGEREGERKGEKHQCVVASCTPSTGDLACNPGMCPRLGIELATLGLTEPHQPGPNYYLKKIYVKVGENFQSR